MQKMSCSSSLYYKSLLAKVYRIREDQSLLSRLGYAWFLGATLFLFGCWWSSFTDQLTRRCNFKELVWFRYLLREPYWFRRWTIFWQIQKLASRGMGKYIYCHRWYCFEISNSKEYRVRIILPLQGLYFRF